MAEENKGKLQDGTFEEDFMCFVIDRIVPFPVILEKAGLEDYDYYGNVYCPFHDNTDTPAAKIYKNDEGDRLYCYANRRQFKPSDVIKRNLLKANLAKSFQNIWKQIPPSKQEALQNRYGEPRKYLSEEFEEKLELLEPFRRGEFDIEEYKRKVLEALKYK